MLRIVGEHGRVESPVFVELRWKLDKVAGHIPQRWVMDVREHPMQSVAELMKHRRHVIKTQQRGLPGRGLRKVGDVDDHRLGAQESALVDKAVVPCAATL